MVLGALLDLGLPLDALREALGSLAFDHGTIAAERVLRAGVAATKFRLHEPERARAHDTRDDHHDHDGAAGHHHHAASSGHPHHDHHHEEHGHAHTHGHRHEHHSLEEIGGFIDRSALSAAGKSRARHLFRRLAEAEAAIHEMPVDRVHLHEVGAPDSIVDIVGAVFGLEWVGAEHIVASPLNVGGGRIHCAHGVFPVPAPATARLLEGVPIYSDGIQSELTTPTGALLVTGYAESFGAIPPMRVSSIGYGAGDKDFAAHPNVLRLLVGESDITGPTERIVVIACEIDDMNPQLFGPLMDRLYAVGALDVYYAPVQMKKNRPGTLVTVIAAPERREALSAVLFTETTTIGVRYQEMHRERLEREVRTIETAVGPIRFKIARRDGRVVNAAPEFDDCARAAAERHIPIKEIQALATKAWLDGQRG